MRKPINITINYSDGTRETFSKQFTSILSKHMKDHLTLEGFIQELFHQYDINYALQQLDSQWEERLDNELQDATVEHKEDKESSMNVQRAILNGLTIQKFFPLWQTNYYAGDIIAVYDTVDSITLVGRNNNSIKEMVFQEVKTGGHDLTKSQQAVRNFVEEINHPNIKFEFWKQRNIGEPFKLVNRSKH